MISSTFFIACLAGAPASTYGSFSVSSAPDSYIPITAQKEAAQWGITSVFQSSSGSTSTYDNEANSGVASNFGQEITNYRSVGTNYNNQDSTSNNAGGLVVQYDSATGIPSYGANSEAPSTSGQSTIVGDQ